MNTYRLQLNFIIRLVIFFGILVNCAVGWAIEKQLALVIGVAEYSHIQNLKNTVNDTVITHPHHSGIFPSNFKQQWSKWSGTEIFR